MRTVGVATLFLLTSASQVQAETSELDPAHSAAAFSVKHLMVSNVRGRFEQMIGTVELDPTNMQKSTIFVEIEAGSLTTGNEKRDAHLKSKDFFEAGNYKTIRFESRQIRKAGRDRYKVIGDLTIRGVTRSITLNVEGPTKPRKTPFGTTVRGVTATGKINRKNWGLTWNQALETGGVLVGYDVDIRIDAELVAKTPPG